MRSLKLMGAVLAIASSSLLTEWVKGKTLEEQVIFATPILQTNSHYHQ